MSIILSLAAIHGESGQRGRHAQPARISGKDQVRIFGTRNIMPAQRVPADHPLRPIRKMTDEALKSLSPEFDRLYSKVGRPSIPPERLLRALLLQCFYGIRSERLLMEQLDYNLLFRWFVGLNMDDKIWDATVFSKNRDRLLEGRIALRFLEEVVAQAREAGLTSDEHFSVDGTLIEAWASQKSFKAKDGSDDEGGAGGGRNQDVDFRGKKRRNDTHQSTTDPQARLYRKARGHEAKLAYLGHVVIENRHALVMGCEVTEALGQHMERQAAVRLMSEVPRRAEATVGGDRAYDDRCFVQDMRARGVTPHVAQNNTARRSAIDGRTTRHAGYATSQVLRKLVEHPFGWIKSAAGLWQVKHRGRAKVDWVVTFGMAAYNLVRMRKLLAVAS
jgi:transposase